MNIKAMRNVHLYLGCFFAPLLILFLITGCWQTFGLHQASKEVNGYKPPQIIKSLSQVHMDQRWADSRLKPQPSVIFRYLIILMSLGLLVTTVLGIMMAFKYTRPWLVWACLFLGIFIPFFLLWMARGYAQEASATDEIVVKSANAVMFQVTANMKLTQDQINAIQPVITDNIVKVRDLQLSLENGAIDGKTMYDKRQKLINDQNEELSHILTPDQMKVWTNMQQYQ